MIFEELISRLKTLRVAQLRIQDRDYFEAVFWRKDIHDWEAALSGFLDAPLKGADKEPNKEHIKLVKDFGGIWSRQTLFFKDFENCRILAMFWPWDDQEHITLKLILI